MPRNPPENMPRITPAVIYEDAKAALAWLEKAFGFKTRLAIPGEGGQIVHSEMEVFDSVIFVGPAGARPGWTSPKMAGGVITQGLFIYVDDVDAHCERARQAGAEILSEPEDQIYGDRKYEVRDPEGHIWVFAQHVKDVPLEEMEPPKS